MKIKEKIEFIDEIRKFNIETEYIIVKPNWVSNKFGEYTEPEIIDWLFESFPKQKKIVIESYTPWRGLNGTKINADLIEGKKFWEDYQNQDREFLKETGNEKILKKHKVEYINITNEVWANRCIEPEIIKKEVNNIKFEEFYGYIPEKIYKLKNKSTLISLAKIKTEEENKKIIVSLSIKNLFGLIPDPKRDKYHRNNDKNIFQAIIDIFKIYTSIFRSTLWINEGIRTLVNHYCTDDQTIEKNKNLLFVGKNPIEVDSGTCWAMGVDPNKILYLK